MQSSDRKFDSDPEDFFSGRLATTLGRICLILVTVSVLAISVIEMAVALNLQFSRTLAREAKLTGSLMWAAVAITIWADKLSVWAKVSVTAVASVSVAAMYIPNFATFALWANAVIWALLLILFLRIFPHYWGCCAAVPKKY